MTKKTISQIHQQEYVHHTYTPDILNRRNSLLLASPPRFSDEKKKPMMEPVTGDWSPGARYMQPEWLCPKVGGCLGWFGDAQKIHLSKRQTSYIPARLPVYPRNPRLTFR